MRLHLGLWTAFLAAIELIVFLALPGWDRDGDIPGLALFLIFTVLLMGTWLAGVAALVIVRRVRNWVQRRNAPP